MSHLFTSESVTAGYPDKVVDPISDGIMDAVQGQALKSRVAAKTFVSNQEYKPGQWTSWPEGRWRGGTVVRSKTGRDG